MLKGNGLDNFIVKMIQNKEFLAEKLEFIHATSYRGFLTASDFPNFFEYFSWFPDDYY